VAVSPRDKVSTAGSPAGAGGVDGRGGAADGVTAGTEGALDEHPAHAAEIMIKRVARTASKTGVSFMVKGISIR